MCIRDRYYNKCLIIKGYLHTPDIKHRYMYLYIHIPPKNLHMLKILERLMKFTDNNNLC